MVLLMSCKLSRLLLGVMVAALSLPLVPASPAAAHVTGTPVKVMLLGDSITEGLTGGDFSGNETLPTYRYYLHNQLQTVDASFDFVGSENGTADVSGGIGVVEDTDVPITEDPLGVGTWDQDHEGHQGWRADQIWEATYWNSVGIADWAADHTPDVVVINLGANDIIQNQSGANIEQDIIEIIGILRTQNPTVVIVLTTLIDLAHPLNLDAQADIDELNGIIRGMPAVHTLAESPVVLADIALGYNGATMNVDDIHPNATGGQHIATILGDTLCDPDTAILVCNEAPTASFTANCINLSCTFNASESTDDDTLTDYAWTFGDTQTGTGVAAANTYTTSDTYDVTLTVTDPHGTTDVTNQSVSVTSVTCSDGYWLLEEDSQVYNFGNAPDHADEAGSGANAVDIQATPDGCGHWVVRADGTVTASGGATALGNFNLASLEAGESLNTISSTVSGNGLWGFTTKGRVLTLGDATSFGDLLAFTLNGGIIDSATTPSGDGYYMLGSDGGIFAFGDAVYVDSLPGLGINNLNSPAVGLVPDPDGTGYWIVAGDGGVFGIQAPYRGSIPGLGIGPLNKDVIGMVPYGNGYLMVAKDGGVFNFSDRAFNGSLGANPPNTDIVSITPLP